MNRLRATLLVACAVHLGTLATLARITHPTRLPVAVDAPIEMAIETEPALPPAIEAPEPDAPRDTTPALRPRIASAAATDRGAAIRGPAADNAGSEAVLTREPSAPHEASSAEGWTFAPTRPDLNLGTTARYGAPAREGERPTTSAPPAPKWSAAADEADVALGLTRGGAALAAARDLTREGSTPIDGYAIFDATSDALGVITDVRVIEVSSDLPSWEEVAKGMVPALASKRFNVPPGARGLVVRIRVDSKWQYPDGRSARGPKPSAAVRTVLLPLAVAMGGDPTERNAPLRFVSARVIDERPL